MMCDTYILNERQVFENVDIDKQMRKQNVIKSLQMQQRTQHPPKYLFRNSIVQYV